MAVEKTKFICQRGKLKIRGNKWRQKSGKLPAIILSHGFLANEKMCHTYAKLFAKMGYVAFTFDFCGGGLMSLSDGKSKDMSVLTEMEDLEAVLNYVKNQDDVVGEDISLLGCSQGGFVSSLVAKMHPEIKNLILLYPAFCIPDDARKGHMLFSKFDPNNIPEIISYFPMKIGKGYVEAVKDWDFQEIIKGYEGKTVLIHGTADKIVPIAYARQGKNSFVNCKYYEIEGGAHKFNKAHDKQAMHILYNEMKLPK